MQGQHQVRAAAVPFDLHADAMSQLTQENGPALRRVAVAISDAGGGWCYDDDFHVEAAKLFPEEAGWLTKIS
jgi:hypothetical protein